MKGIIGGRVAFVLAMAAMQQYDPVVRETMTISDHGHGYEPIVPTYRQNGFTFRNEPARYIPSRSRKIKNKRLRARS